MGRLLLWDIAWAVCQTQLRKEGVAMKRCGVILLAALLMQCSTVLASEKCPSCGASMYNTCETKSEWGKLFQLYKCPSGHGWWIEGKRAFSPPSLPTPPTLPTLPKLGGDMFSVPKCPVCGAGLYFTGETYMEWGKLFKVYNCPSGHRSVSTK